MLIQLQMFIARFCSVLEVSITCDGCGAQIPGPRYRCMDCMDIDLCGVCFSGGVMPSGTEHTTDHNIVYMSSVHCIRLLTSLRSLYFMFELNLNYIYSAVSIELKLQRQWAYMSV